MTDFEERPDIPILGTKGFTGRADELTGREDLIGVEAFPASPEVQAILDDLLVLAGDAGAVTSAGPVSNVDFEITTFSEVDEEFDPLLPVIEELTAIAIAEWTQFINPAEGAFLDVAVTVTSLGETAIAGSFFVFPGAVNEDGIFEFAGEFDDDGNYIITPVGLSEVRDGIDTNGDLPDIDLVVNIDFLGAPDAFLESDPDREVPAGFIDFLSVQLHELGHAFGITGFLEAGDDEFPVFTFPTPDFGVVTAPVASPFDLNVITDDLVQPFLTGASLEEGIGDITPLEFVTGPGSDLVHWAGLNDPRQPDFALALMNPFLFSGQVVDIGAGELFILEDLGIDVTIPDDLPASNEFDPLVAGTPTVFVGEEALVDPEGVAIPIEVSSAFITVIPSGVGFEVLGADGEVAQGRVTFPAPATLPPGEVFSPVEFAFVSFDGLLGADLQVNPADAADSFDVRLISPTQANLPGGNREEVFTVDVNFVAGTEGDDEISAEDGGPAIFGGAGDDLLIGTAGDDTLVGGTGDDEIVGLGGSDILDGGDGNDIITGGPGPDAIIDGDGDDIAVGGSGDDLFISGAGDDILEGGGGVDFLDLSDQTESVTVDLDVNSAGAAGTPSLEGVASGEGLGTDLLLEFENVLGGSGDDLIFGNNMPNALFGGGGDDTIHGFGGADLLDGGDGVDTVLFAATPGVTIDLAAGFGGPDAIVNFENATGSAMGPDVILGDAGDNILTGLGGDDVLNGREGDDLLDGGEGTDTFVLDEGFGVDLLFFESETDLLDIRASSEDAVDVAAALEDGVLDAEDDIVLDLDGSTIALFIGDDAAILDSTTSVSAEQVSLTAVFDAVSYWPSTDDSGDVLTDVAGGFNGVLDGAVFTADGPVGTGISFDGVDDSVTVANAPAFALDEGSFSVWFNSDVPFGETQTLVSKDEAFFGDGGHFNLQVNADNSLSVRLQSTDESVTVTGGFAEAGEFNHVVVNFGEETGLQLFVNGDLVGEDGFTGGIGSNMEDFVFGASGKALGFTPDSGLTDFFDGVLDEFALFDEALSAGEVALLFETGLEGETIVVDGSALEFA